MQDFVSTSVLNLQQTSTSMSDIYSLMIIQVSSYIHGRKNIFLKIDWKFSIILLYLF